MVPQPDFGIGDDDAGGHVDKVAEDLGLGR
jgi:hypothetical protein